MTTVQTSSSATQLSYEAAICIEGAVFALMSIARQLEALGTDATLLAVLCGAVDAMNELEDEVAEEFQRLAGRRHPVLDPY